MHHKSLAVTILATFKAVFWSFLGVRRGEDHDADMANLKPLHVAIVGVLCCVLFVLTLLLVVKIVLS